MEKIRDISLFIAELFLFGGGVCYFGSLLYEPMGPYAPIFGILCVPFFIIYGILYMILDY